MFGHFAEIKEAIYKDIDKFRQKQALSPETAKSIDELGVSAHFKAFLSNSPRMFGIFVKVDEKYYLSEARLNKIEEQLSLSPLRQWLRHTASVPKGLLRFYVFKLLKEKPMSGSDITEEIEKQTGGQWKPSPGSVYPLLTWLRANGYAEELPRESSGVKRYALTDKGAKFFEANASFKDELQKKVSPVGPLFLLRMGLNADGLQGLQGPVKRMFDSLFELRVALMENMTEQTVTEVEEVLNDISEKIEELTKKLKGVE
ncbi:MAG: PadR family transcriptional regulator [Candidatus Bathyarchaeia archaeon]|jgi:DNA-binding PadR family transcriptional regulator